MYTFTTFRLDFEGLGPLGGFTNRKTALRKTCVFELKRNTPKYVLYDSKRFVGFNLEVQMSIKHKLGFHFVFQYLGVSGVRFGTTFC